MTERRFDYDELFENGPAPRNFGEPKKRKDHHRDGGRRSNGNRSHFETISEDENYVRDQLKRSYGSIGGNRLGSLALIPLAGLLVASAFKTGKIDNASRRSVGSAYLKGKIDEILRSIKEKSNV